MTAKTYPSPWRRVEQRGCTPNGAGCLHMDWPLERCDVSPSVRVTRHVMPKGVLRYCLDATLCYWRTERVEGDARWAAYGRRADEDITICTGASEREAMQNLCNEMKVKLP